VIIKMRMKALDCISLAVVGRLVRSLPDGKASIQAVSGDHSVPISFFVNKSNTW
jgi:hypothetical protein